MAEHNWVPITLKIPFASELEPALDSLQSAVNTITEILNTAKKILEIAKLVATAASADPLEIIIKQILDEIDALLNSISEKTNIHAIIVPIRKQPFGIGVEVNFNETLANNGGDIPPTYAQLDENNTFIGSASQYLGTVPAEVARFINTAAYSVGGTRGFYQTLVESTVDLGDINRPLFDDTFAVTGGCVIFTTSSFADLAKILGLFLSLLKLGDRSDPLRNTFVPPQNLRAKIIPITTVSAANGRMGVVLDWDKPQLRINFPLYNDEEALIKEIIIIRSTDLVLREKFSWPEIFSVDLTDDLNDLPSTPSGRTKVIKRIRNDGFTGRYVDDDASLKENTVYYYTLAFRHQLNKEFLPVNYFSNVVRIQAIRPLVSANSEPPDWYATPSLVQLFPVLEEIVGFMRLILAELQTKSFSGPTILDQLIVAIDTLIKKGEFANLILQEIVNLLRAINNNSLGGLYSTSITVPQGGMDAWLSELARRLSNSADTTRPLDDPKDLVTGLVMVAGAPTIGSIDTSTPFNVEILALEKLFELIFGGGNSNPILNAIAAVNTPYTTTTKTTFDSNMQPVQIPITQAPTTTSVTFDAQMLPTKTLC